MIVRSIAAILSFVLLQSGRSGSFKLSIPTGYSCRQVVVGARSSMVLTGPGRCCTDLLLAAGHIDCDCLREQASQFPLYKYLLSGAAAGGCRALSRSFTYPLDTLKTYQQTTAQERRHKLLQRHSAVDFLRHPCQCGVLCDLQRVRAVLLVFQW